MTPSSTFNGYDSTHSHFITIYPPIYFYIYRRAKKYTSFPNEYVRISLSPLINLEGASIRASPQDTVLTVISELIL